MKTLERTEIKWADSLGEAKENHNGSFLSEKEVSKPEEAVTVEEVRERPIDEVENVTVMNMASPIKMTLDLAKTIEENAKRQAEINAIYGRGSILEDKMEQLEARYTQGLCV